jgi:hypothetical protein
VASRPVERVGNRPGGQVLLLTPAGRRQLVIEKDSWSRLTGAINLIFEEGNQ